jgi:Zn finger protein HypA/HybF involved in hydrogenase expression
MSHNFTVEEREKSHQVRRIKSVNRVLKEGTHPSGHYLKKLLIEFEHREYKCEICGIDSWHGHQLKLQIDHINGIHHDNRPENLRFICPNCHSLTDTFCGAGNTGSHKVIDKDLIDAIVSSRNIRRALMKVGLTPKGGNYVRVQELIAKYDLKFDK